MSEGPRYCNKCDYQADVMMKKLRSALWKSIVTALAATFVRKISILKEI
jgi:hypothetical protein